MSYQKHQSGNVGAMLGLFLGLILLLTAAGLVVYQKDLPMRSVYPDSSSKPLSLSELSTARLDENSIQASPDLKRKKTLLDGATLYEVKSPNLNRDNLAVYQQHKLQFARLLTLDTDLSHPLYSEYLQKYGQPEQTLTGNKYYGRNFRTHIYTKVGLGLVINPSTEEIYEIHKFAPESLSAYLTLWVDY